MAEVIVRTFNTYGVRKDVAFETTVWYRDADGRNHWTCFCTDFCLFKNAADQIAHALEHQTDFVKENWVRIEVSVPNRDAYGNLVPGYIQDTGMLLATRNLEN